MKRFPLLMCVVVLVGILSATAFEPQGKSKGKKDDQQSQKDKDKDKDKSKDKDKAATDDNAPKPLFQGKVGIKSSSQGKDSAALAMNGLDPEGHVTKDQMAKNPTKADKFSAMSLVAYSPTPDELSKFMASGNLKAGTPPTGQEEKKKKK